MLMLPDVDVAVLAFAGADAPDPAGFRWATEPMHFQQANEVYVLGVEHAPRQLCLLLCEGNRQFCRWVSFGWCKRIECGVVDVFILRKIVDVSFVDVSILSKIVVALFL